ncbi:MAG: response regulator [Acidobacteria bacterium]|nr:response regulator [Acidobacteriota bacterium]MBI3656492.1 response regulator [Acidobacteriota bacterium]
MRILVIEDEVKVASFIKKGLEQEQYSVDIAHDGEEGLYLAENNPYDLLLLDLMLPKMSGLQVLTALRKKKPALPIMILTAKAGVEDRVQGLDCGGDDYLVKPFAFAELLARLRALLRRGHREVVMELRAGDLVLDPVKHRITRAGKVIELSNKEYALLEYLMRNAGQVVTRTMIAEHVWDLSFDSFTNVIDVYINFLRNKIDRGFPTRLLHTVRGVGYKLSATEGRVEHEY